MIVEPLNSSLRPFLPTKLALNATGDMINPFFQVNCAISTQKLLVCCQRQGSSQVHDSQLLMYHLMYAIWSKISISSDLLLGIIHHFIFFF